MRYMLLIYSREAPKCPPKEQKARLRRHISCDDGSCAARNRSMRPRAVNAYQAARPQSTRRSENVLVHHDGPFAETKEQLAGTTYSIVNTERGN